MAPLAILAVGGVIGWCARLMFETLNDNCTCEWTTSCAKHAHKDGDPHPDPKDGRRWSQFYNGWTAEGVKP